MSLGFLEQARNESMARRELSIQSHALLVVRTLDSIYSALQRNPFDGVDLMRWRQSCISLTPCFIMLTASAGPE